MGTILSQPFCQQNWKLKGKTHVTRGVHSNCTVCAITEDCSFSCIFQNVFGRKKMEVRELRIRRSRNSCKRCMGVGVAGLLCP